MIKKCKKAVSAAVVSAIIAAQALMPVAAAGSGEITVPVGTKAAAIQVIVPTTLEVAIDQFEKGATGAQIHSSNFDIKNNSEIAVKVKVNSIVELGSQTVLKSKKTDATTSTKKGEAWLAVAAQTASGTYGSAAAIGAVTEADTGVTTFDQNGTQAIASQTFYLKKATGVNYNIVRADNGGDRAAHLATLGYTEFMELTEISKASGTVTIADVEAALEKGDVLAVKANGETGAVQGDQLTVISQGDKDADTDGDFDTSGHTFETTNTYYTMASVATAPDKLDATKEYAYGAGTMDAAAGQASFRYTGNLSSAQEVWNDTDINKVTLKYEIMGVSDTQYTKVATTDANVVWGFYKGAPEGTSVTAATASGATTLTIANLETDAYAGFKVVVDGATYDVDKGWGTWTWPEDDSADKVFTLDATIVDWLKGDSVADHNVKFTVEKSDGTWVSVVHTFS